MHRSWRLQRIHYQWHEHYRQTRLVWHKQPINCQFGFQQNCRSHRSSNRRASLMEWNVNHRSLKQKPHKAHWRNYSNAYSRVYRWTRLQDQRSKRYKYAIAVLNWLHNFCGISLHPSKSNYFWLDDDNHVCGHLWQRDLEDVYQHRVKKSWQTNCSDSGSLRTIEIRQQWSMGSFYFLKQGAVCHCKWWFHTKDMGQHNSQVSDNCRLEVEWKGSCLASRPSDKRNSPWRLG